MQRIVKWSKICGSIILVSLAIILALVWPPFTGFEEEITGVDFQATELLTIDDTGVSGEGQKIWIYRLPEDAADHLATNHRIEKYPMWCGLALDGYRRLKWAPTVGSNSETVASLINAVFPEPTVNELGLADIVDINDAIAFASSLAQREQTQIAGWYYQQGGWPNERWISNYFVYLINIKKRLFIKISLLT